MAEATLRNGVGARIWLEDVCERDGVDAFTLLFSVPPAEEDRFIAVCTAKGFAQARIGMVDDVVGALEVQGQFTLPLDELRTAHTSTLPDIFAAT